MARPRKEIDRSEFEKLCSLQCTKAEICGFFDITDKTLDAWVRRTYGRVSFSEVYEKKRAGGLISLRHSQFQMSEKNATMAIWLGKQYLGQRDQVEVATDDNDMVLRFIEGMKGDKAKSETDGISGAGG